MVGSRVLFCSPHTDTTGSWPTLFSPVLPGQFLLPTALTLRYRYQVCQAPWQVPHKLAEDNEVMTPPFCYRAFPLESRVPLSFVVTSSGAMPRRFLYLTSLDSPTSSCLLWLRKLGSPLCASPLLHPLPTVSPGAGPASTIALKSAFHLSNSPSRHHRAPKSTLMQMLRQQTNEIT